MIDIKKKILLGEFPQKIHIRTEDRNNPILLFLHGGPGVCNRDVIFTEHLDLLDTFTLVAWDQRGSVGSYKGIDPETLTINQMVEDAKELIEWLCKEFSKDKVFVIGSSGYSMYLEAAYMVASLVATIFGVLIIIIVCFLDIDGELEKMRKEQ